MLQAKIKCPCCGHSISVRMVSVQPEVRFRSVDPAGARPGEIQWVKLEDSGFMQQVDSMFDNVNRIFDSVFSRKPK